MENNNTNNNNNETARTKLIPYYVEGCKVTNKQSFTGYVLNINDEPITNSIKRKLNKSVLLCETTNEAFDYSKVSIFQIPLSDISLGEYMIITGNYSVS